MATPQEKLAGSLEALKALQDNGIIAIRAGALSRTHRERLLKNGFIQEVMKGWYIAARPGEGTGDSTAWYASFWDFCAAYLRTRFGKKNWCLSPDQSLSIHGGNLAVPSQLLVRTPDGGNKPTSLLYGTSIFDMRLNMPKEQDVIEQNGLRLFSLPAALIDASPAFFVQHPLDARTALATVADASDVVRRLLEGGHSAIAGRLSSAFRNIGRERIADDIVKAMRVAGYDIREQDPFENRIDLNLPKRERSPYAGRVRLMWQQMREAVIEQFPQPGSINDIDAYLQRVEEAYITDAYNSLSIEGYRVSVELIDRVRMGNWNPDAHEEDRKHAGALAARGYWQAFQAVKTSVRSVLENKNPGTVADEDHGTWYREMFAPKVTAGIIQAANLAGYRNSPVYIRNSMHVPLPGHAVPDAMEVFFEMLENETHPAVRVVLGHFVFVYIHPYMDGNGRLGRFLMNVMLAAGGYPWTIVPLQQRTPYMAALEEASVRQTIVPFAKFTGDLVREALKGKTVATVPTQS